jgi:hypothetical protein
MRTLRATTASDLASMASELHDSWIELPELGERSPPATIRMGGRLEFGGVRPLRYWGPLVRVEELKPKLELSVEAVTRVVMEDLADIGGLTVAGMEFDAAAGTVTIEGNVPVTVVMSVESLGVTAVIIDEIAERRERWRWRSRLPAGESPRIRWRLSP